MHEIVALGVQRLDVVFAAEHGGHVDQNLAGQKLLHTRVVPNHVAMGKRDVIARLQPRQIVHPAAPAAGPIGAVAPGVVVAQPFMIGHQAGENLCQPVFVAEVFKVFPFAPRHNVRAGGGGVKAREMVAAGVFLDLAADVAVGILVGIKVVERALKIKRARAVFAEHQNERRIPHKNAAVERGVNKAGHIPRARRRFAKIAERKKPRFVIAAQRVGVAVPHGARKLFFFAFIGRKRAVFRLHMGKDVFFHKPVFDDCEFVVKAVFHPATPSFCAVFFLL